MIDSHRDHHHHHSGNHAFEYKILFPKIFPSFFFFHLSRSPVSYAPGAGHPIFVFILALQPRSFPTRLLHRPIKPQLGQVPRQLEHHIPPLSSRWFQCIHLRTCSPSEYRASVDVLYSTKQSPFLILLQWGLSLHVT